MDFFSTVMTQWWPGGGGGETPDLMPGLDESDITPGIAGFLFTALMVGLLILVVRDLAKRVRRMKYRSQVEAELNGEEPEFPGEITPAGISEAQQRARDAAYQSRFGPAEETHDAGESLDHEPEPRP
ncbi:hypothetical protein [Nesterenkonia alba]|uniref:hypothetical protein n=1 Tax=Nesterenkonia alba TaxID=515814 RepID=UPI0003B6D451|nr:hypothetical protein [Nesterenkonia alba]